MGKWETIQQLVDRMPGGRYIGSKWADEKRSTIAVSIDIKALDPGQKYSFAANLIIAAVEEFGLQDKEDNVAIMVVPRLIVDMLTFWSDPDGSFWTDGEATND